MDSVKKFIIITGIILSLILLSGCTDDSENDYVSKLEEMGSYTINKASDAYGMGEDPEEEIMKNLEKMEEMAQAPPPQIETKLEYSLEFNLAPDGKIIPYNNLNYNNNSFDNSLSLDGLDAYSLLGKPLDTNVILMSLISDYLEGANINLPIPTNEVDMLKKLEITFKDFAVTNSFKMTGRDGYEYISQTNTFQTKPIKGDKNPPLIGYINIIYRQEGSVWVPVDITDTEIYTPTGELGFRYMGSALDNKDNVVHGWMPLEGADIPIWNDVFDTPSGKIRVCDAMGKMPLFIADIRDDIRAYEEYSSGPQFEFDIEQRKKEHAGGKVIAMKNGVVSVGVFPEGEYLYHVYDDTISAKYMGHTAPRIGVSEKSAEQKKKGFGMNLETTLEFGDLVKIKDGMDDDNHYNIHPADGNAELIGCHTK